MELSESFATLVEEMSVIAMAEVATSHELIDGLRPIWVDAERRLYPLATTAPDLYMSAVNVVRWIADQLSDTATSEALAERWRNRSDLSTSAAEEPDLDVSPLIPVDQLVGAAFALVDREVNARIEADLRRLRVVDARIAGSDWARLHEKGDVARGLADPYQSIDFHLETGLAVVSSVEQMPSGGGQANYVVAVIEMDAEGSSVLQVDVKGFDDRETISPADFVHNQLDARAAVEATAC